MGERKITAVQIWLLVGLFMILMQVFIGGITRLTGSGLSITKWDIITGIFPPIHESDWNKEFDLYKQTPQYHKINKGMNISDFKFIYFWEYFHRLWARSMGFVFLIPFIYFYIKGKLSSKLKSRLVKVFFLAVSVASLGWIMVASGLIERPWVNAYKLSLHLCLALILFLYLLRVVVKEFNVNVGNSDFHRYRFLYKILSVLLFIQIFLGGMMSGMKAALLYPTWPKIGQHWIPEIVLSIDNWTFYNFGNYDKHLFLPTLIHFLHRNLAYICFAFSLYIFFRTYNLLKSNLITNAIYLQLLLFLSQVLLGILILLNSQGSIPIWFGVFHQIIGFLLIGSCIFILETSSQNK